jgi:GNAT superfamily N-acetyltransferase
MPDLIIHDELISTHGALSVYHASIDELNRRYGGSDEDKLLHVEELLPPNGAFVVARLDGHPIGGVGLRPISDPVRRLGEIKRLWVRPDQRRNGVGALLMTAVEERAREIGYLQLYLESGYAQPEALELYRTHGWDTVAEYPPGAHSYHLANRFTKQL